MASGKFCLTHPDRSIATCGCRFACGGIGWPTFHHDSFLFIHDSSKLFNPSYNVETKLLKNLSSNPAPFKKNYNTSWHGNFEPLIGVTLFTNLKINLIILRRDSRISYVSFILINSWTFQLVTQTTLETCTISIFI